MVISPLDTIHPNGLDVGPGASVSGGNSVGGGSHGGDDWLYVVLYRIRWTFLPIVVAGTITNCLNFVVLSRKEMRYTLNLYLHPCVIVTESI